MLVHPIRGVPMSTIPDEDIRKGGSTGRIGYFGMTRNNGEKMHKGVDIVCAMGAPVYAMHDGRVTHAGLERGRDGNPSNIGYGLRLYISNATHTSVYGHLCHQAVGVSDEVLAGQLVGFAGWSGNADPRDIHLHMEIRRPSPVDPMQEFENVADEG